MPKNNGFPPLWTLGQMAEELNIPYRRLRYITHHRRGPIAPRVVLRNIHYYDQTGRDQILGALAEIAERRRSFQKTVLV